MYSVVIGDERESKGAGRDCCVGMSVSDLALCWCREAPQPAWLLAELGSRTLALSVCETALAGSLPCAQSQGWRDKQEPREHGAARGGCRSLLW